jgi:hypothetical protein
MISSQEGQQHKTMQQLISSSKGGQQLQAAAQQL